LADVDGTLVDSSVAVAEAWREVAGRFGVDAEAVLRVCHGRRDEDVVDDFFPPRTHDAVLDLIAGLELKQAGRYVPGPVPPRCWARGRTTAGPPSRPGPGS
jgi:sugar-phosphatase